MLSINLRLSITDTVPETIIPMFLCLPGQLDHAKYEVKDSIICQEEVILGLIKDIGQGQ